MSNKNQSKQRVLIFGVCVSLLLVYGAFAASSSLINLYAQRRATQKQERTKKEPPPRERDKKEQPRQNEAKPSPSTAPTASATDSAAALGRDIERAVVESRFAFARWGVYAISLRDGRVLYARDADKTFTPASNMKVYTTAVALDLLGAEHRWRTSVYSESAPASDGTIKGDLTLYGRGAPDLASRAKRDAPDHLAQLADDLYKRGVRRVRGDVVGDESYLRGEPLGDGWMWNDVQWYFGAEVSALTVNSNETTMTITSAKKAGEQSAIKFDAGGDYFRVTDDTKTATGGSPLTIGVTRGLSDNDVRVWGDFAPGGRSYSVRLSAHKPALWAATLFLSALRARGITVDGEARMIDARSRRDGEQSVSTRGVELAYVNSRTLGEIVRPTNKESLNLNAELILRTLGKERGEMAPEPDPVRMRIRGDDQAGAAVVRMWLERAGIATGTLALHDGSGLSRLDRVTPEATARLLAQIAKTSSANVFRDSLPVSGRDGTLRSRLNRASGRILAKTGTLTYTNSLSGYATTADNEPLAFSIICNDETIKESSTEVIDAIAILLAQYSER
ncbi:MAG: D-alanyl-D-alanine carboxypeptidase/D-alanyl-D-alanine-endopeptidase [Pyrinomonadaceae bacterium]